jgi:hypothetical protein
MMTHEIFHAMKENIALPHVSAETMFQLDSAPPRLSVFTPAWTGSFLNDGLGEEDIFPVPLVLQI